MPTTPLAVRRYTGSAKVRDRGLQHKESWERVYWESLGRSQRENSRLGYRVDEAPKAEISENDDGGLCHTSPMDTSQENKKSPPKLLKAGRRADPDSLWKHLWHSRKLVLAVKQGCSYFHLLQEQEVQEEQQREKRRREERRKRAIRPPSVSSDSDTDREAERAPIILEAEQEETGSVCPALHSCPPVADLTPATAASTSVKVASSDFTAVSARMASNFFDSSDSDKLHFAVGRGRGFMSVPTTPRYTERYLGASSVLAANNNDSGLGQSGPCHSTPFADVNAVQQLSEMIGQMGVQIGDAIVEKLASQGSVNFHTNESAVQKDRLCSSSGSGTPCVNVSISPNREPIVFRGDDSDKCSVTEWIDIMKSYVRKQNYTVAEQSDEIMCRLMGRARDVVRIGLRSDPTLVARENPDVIYNILLQYFSKTSSCLPLADFYSTLPRQKENPVDYWIRVNKAADLAVEGLHRQGRGMENMTEEITRMFIKHCPDPELAYMFKCKPIHEWNAKQIQERIDEYQREKRPITCVSNAAHLCHKATVTHVEDSDATLNGRTVAKSSNYANNTGESNVVMSQQYSSQGDAMLNRMMTMLEQVLEKVQRKDAETSHLHEGRRRSWRKNNMMVCSVCGGKDHSTKSHCMSAKLCFRCFSPGHIKSSCIAKLSQQSIVQEN
ncbi:hypothetical protein SRHO_G00266200 [Serrasalmus rhombeus]